MQENVRSCLIVKSNFTRIATGHCERVSWKKSHSAGGCPGSCTHWTTLHLHLLLLQAGIWQGPGRAVQPSGTVVLLYQTALKEQCWRKGQKMNCLKTAHLLLLPQRHLTEGDSHRVEADTLGSGLNKRHFIGHRWGGWITFNLLPGRGSMSASARADSHSLFCKACHQHRGFFSQN